MTKKLELKLCPGKCLFFYHYQSHPIFGFLNARIQTWFPFSIQICINGREWLARQMQAAGIDYLQQDKTAWRRERDSNPRYPLRYTRFRGARLQPLGHLSALRISY